MALQDAVMLGICLLWHHITLLSAGEGSRVAFYKQVHGDQRSE